jgi:hypothetical protein
MLKRKRKKNDSGFTPEQYLSRWLKSMADLFGLESGIPKSFQNCPGIESVKPSEQLVYDS